MNRVLAILLVPLLTTLVTQTSTAWEMMQLEGYFQNSAVPPTNPNPTVVGLAGRGLVTALEYPLTGDFNANEYTWSLSGVLPVSNLVSGTSTQTIYDVSSVPASLVIYEDPTQDARPTFYNCPADLAGNDPRYVNGAVYLKGRLTSFLSVYDLSSGTGFFSGFVLWDSGTHFVELERVHNSYWSFGGTTTSQFACIPSGDGYDQAMKGRFFLLTLGAKSSTWGQLRRMYR